MNVAYAPAPPPGVAAMGGQQQVQAQQMQQQQQQQQMSMAPQQQQQQQAIVPAYTPSSNIGFQQSYQQAPPPPAVNVAVAAATAPPGAPQQLTQQQQRSIYALPCTRCGYPNCDVQIVGCNCLLHVRCTPVPIRACPNPRCFNSNPASAMNNPNGQGGSGMQGCPLELLPMEFTELDEARRVADLAAKASWRAKEKSRARKKAKLDNGGSASSVSSLDGKDGGSVGSMNMESSATPPPPPTPASSDLRTGRWTTEETGYCDKLIQKFMAGRLPLPEGIKLNEFLSNMLKSKQSRLTKKMKNAKLSSKTFKRTSGYLTDVMEAREFSENEDAFFHSLQNGLERAEIKFHMQKEWRETFSTYCVSHGQPLNVDRWLASVEEMEKRVHRAKDVERMQRRKMMMGHALRQDSQNPDRGVVIENSKQTAAAGQVRPGQGCSDGGQFAVPDPMVSASSVGNEMDMLKSTSSTSLGEGGQSQSVGSPFLQRLMAFVHRHHVPFEYIDAWVPSFVPDLDEAQAPSDAGSVASGSKGGQDPNAEKQPKCRLCFAGSMVAKQVIIGDANAGQTRRAVPLTADETFNLSAFGDYSESFSFDVGCGLPGRVYHMGVPTWEQSVHNAPLHHFERVGGSQQWGIRTVVGIPVPSPNVGRIVVVLYSKHDRSKDHDMVIRLTEEFSRLMPSPKWKLIVDVGQQQVAAAAPPPMQAVGQQQQQQQAPQQQQVMQQQVPQQQQQSLPQQQHPQGMDVQQQQSNGAPPDPATLTSEVISIFGEHMPSDPSNPAFAYLQGFMSLRLLLLRSSRTEQEQDVVNTILSSYSSYKAGGRTRPDIALMLARDFMFLNQQAPQQQQPAMQQGQAQQHPNGQQQYAQQPPMQMQPQQQPQQQPNGQHQYAQQQSYAPAPSQIQQQGVMYSPATSSVNSNPCNMPPPMKQDNYQSNGMVPQQYQQQPQYQQADNSGADLLAMSDLAPMPQDMMATTAATPGGSDGAEEAPAES